MGIGGAGHSGGGLTDTELVISLKPSTNQISILSLPRDLVVSYPSNYGTAYPEYRKINNAYVEGGTELALAKATEVTGLAMHYYVLVDFEAFRKIIDDLGGVDVYVDNGFTDYQYPTYNFGWQTISFAPGWQKLDGERALQYARSRHGNNGEGGDFARARRQQKILLALKTEFLKSSNLFNPATLPNILGDLGEHVKTNAEIWEMTKLLQMLSKMDTNNIINQVIDSGDNGLIHSEIASQTGAYVLIPNKGLGDFSEVNELALNIFSAASSTDTGLASDTNNNNATDTTIVKMEDVVKEKANIAMENGTWTTGLATKNAEELNEQNINVAYVGNSQTKNQTETVIYDLSHGKNSATKQFLEQKFNTTVKSATWPSTDSDVRLGSDLDEQLVDLTHLTKETDFIILLGANALSSTTPL